MLDRKRRVTGRLRFRVLQKFAGTDGYQPAPWVGMDKTARSAASVERWQAIERVIAPLPRGSAMDLGCQIGYFSLRMGEAGFLTVGVEARRAWVEAARSIQDAAAIQNVVFLNQWLDNESVRRLPTVDVTLFLSLWHHLCNGMGFEAAKRFLTEVLSRTRTVCIFETGQSDEPGMPWTDALPRMEPTPREWIPRMLRDCGATRVEHLGEFATHLTPVRRHMFAAYTSPHGNGADR